MLSSVLVLALSVAIPSHLQTFPSDHPALPPGERWIYDVVAPHGTHRAGHIELSVFDDGARQSAVVRLTGLAVAEVVGRPRAVLLGLAQARAPVFQGVLRTATPRTSAAILEAFELAEDEPAAALAWLLHASAQHLEIMCDSRWTGKRWAAGARCGEFVVTGACRVGARAGVRVEMSLAFKTTPGNQAAILEACVDPALALPLGVEVRDGGEMRLEARLAEHGPAEPIRDAGRLPEGLWPLWPPDREEPPSGPRRAIELGRGVAYEARLEPQLPAKRARRYCADAPLRTERRGDFLAIYAAKPRRLVGSLVYQAPEVRVEGSAGAARLVVDDVGRELVLAPLQGYERVPRCTWDAPTTMAEQLRADTERTLTPLHAAIERDDLAAVRRLLDGGAMIDALPAPPRGYPRKMYGATPLRLAAGYGYSDIAALLLERGADPNAHVAPHQHASQPLLPSEQPPLFAAIKAGHADVVALLLARGARWDFGTKKQPHALAVAVWDRRIYAMLLAAGAPAGYREVYEAVQRKDAAALRAALSDGRWAEDACRLANAEWWKEGGTLAEEAKRAR